MESWRYFLMTAVAILVIAVFILAVRFFRKMYFMIEEIDARLIQMRNIMQPPSGGQPGGAEGRSARPR